MVRSWRMEGLIASHLVRPPRQATPTVLGRAELIQGLRHQAEGAHAEGRSNPREGVWIDLGAAD